MSEWKNVRLSDVAVITDFVANGSFASLKENVQYLGKESYAILIRLYDFHNDWKGPFVYVDKGSFDFLKKSSVEPGDLIIANVGANAGKSFLAPSIGKKMTLGPNSVLIKGENRKYLYYYFNSPIGKSQLDSIITGSAQPKFNKTDLRSLVVNLPDLPTQKAIAEILSSLDDKIELNNQINQNLEALAQALFKQWFVDFEFPNENGVPYKSSGGEMVDSELGEIPKRWDVGVLSDILDFNPTEKLSRGVASSYLDMSSLPTSGSFPQLPIKRDFSSGMKFRNGDTLLARITPCLENGKTAFIQFLNENEVGWGSTEFIVLRPKANWPKEVGYLIARDEGFRNFAIQNLVGTSGRQRVASSILMNYPIIIPTNKSILEGFGSIVSDLFEKIKANSFENIHLTQLRDTLLPKLISGELEVNQIEDGVYG